MRRVEFISIEDDSDLIVSFALAPAAYDSFTLIRSPQLEWALPEDERGTSVSTLDPADLRRNLLVSVTWRSDTVIVKTELYEHKLDVSRVDADEVAEAKVVLRKMVADGLATFEDK
ncbi:hypothetical protein ASC87_23685 [Rhizobacter sp. Root1221]|nr:hypothetical protein ASC87_23685 [Rhizobacter sp. Root1221]